MKLELIDEFYYRLSRRIRLPLKTDNNGSSTTHIATQKILVVMASSGPKVHRNNVLSSEFQLTRAWRATGEAADEVGFSSPATGISKG